LHGLVKGGSGRAQPVGEHVDRHAADRSRHQYLALVRAQLALDRLAQRGELSVTSTDCSAVR
jgi:hypothetical protein